MKYSRQVEAQTPEGSARSGAITISGLERTYATRKGDVVALEDVDLEVRQGEFLCIVGPSGCGKSTLLRILAGLDHPTGGTVDFDIDAGGEPLVSMVFQEQGVFPWLSVTDNVAYGLTVRGVPKAERRERAATFIDRVGLSKFADSYPHQLSGGMRQRVNIARAFCNGPAVLLMDEPMASLDEQTKMILQDDLIHLWEGTGRTVVFITHSLDEAVLLGDRVAVMSRRPGRIKQIVDVGLERPRDVLELRNSEAFISKRREVWDLLRSEFITLSEGASR